MMDFNEHINQVQQVKGMKRNILNASKHQFQQSKIMK